MKKPRIKAILSTLLLLFFLILATTGAMLYFGKTGLVLGFARNTLRVVHALIALLMCLLIAAHLFLNRRAYLKEMKASVRNKGTDSK